MKYAELTRKLRRVGFSRKGVKRRYLVRYIDTKFDAIVKLLLFQEDLYWYFKLFYISD